MPAEDVEMRDQEMNLSSSDGSRIRVSESLQEEQPHFPKLSAVQANNNRSEYRRVRCPPHRYTPLREHWEQILTPLVEYLKLQVRNGWTVAQIFGAQDDVIFDQERRAVPRLSNPLGNLGASRRGDAAQPLSDAREEF